MFDIRFGLIYPRNLKIHSLNRRTDGQQNDLIRVPFLRFEVRNPKKNNSLIYNLLDCHNFFIRNVRHGYVLYDLIN